jgi:UDPglucose 6-dehydrogenase
MSEKIAIIGIGFVGEAIMKSLISHNFELNKNLFIYDKYKNGGLGSLNDCLIADIIFLALPTPYDTNSKEYDKTSIYDTCENLKKANYDGVIIIKSTIEPETTNKLSEKYPELNIIHNPEFLSAKTACEDFHNQKHIVIGTTVNCNKDKLNNVIKFYTQYYKNAEISLSTSLESESMKIFCNSFYAVKIQFFTELFLLCQSNNCDYNKVKELMFKNNWINPMHTNIPGSDGSISYGGLCFPKDTNALLNYMDNYNIPNSVLKNTILERNEMRKDNSNIN